MGLNNTVSAERVHIGFFGLRNVGKSSVVNAVTGQELSLVSDIKGTTTDPVQKAMELLPLGPVVIIDTPGIDDEGSLGEMRVARAMKMLEKTDIAVLVTDSTREATPAETELSRLIEQKEIPLIIAHNKCDLLSDTPSGGDNEIYVSAKDKTGISALKELIGRLSSDTKKEKPLISDLISQGDTVVLVTPIDSSAPKGRLILPQQQVIRDILDSHAFCVVTQVSELSAVLSSLNTPPKMVITDSQAFGAVNKIVPENIPLTSFSILFARYKGELDSLVRGAAALDRLSDGDTVLISEGCTHHRQCGDIGTVKMPAWLESHTGKKLNFEFTSGGEFPDDLSGYALVVHCGGCMLNEREMLSRLHRSLDSGVPMTNYGITIAHIHGILRRSLTLFPSVLEIIGRD